MSDTPVPAEYVRPPFDADRRERVLARLQRRWSRPWRSRVPVLAAAAILLVVMGGLVGVGLRESSTAPEATIEPVHEPTPHAPDNRVVVLSERSRLELAPRTELRVAREADQASTLLRGELVCVTDHEAVTIEAAGVRVEITHGRVRVRHEDRLEVETERGEARVVDGERVIELPEGERWTRREPVVEPAPAPPAQRRRRRATAAELFERARARRTEGQPARAASAYEELVRRHPRDGRAGLAAFEAGRLRLHELGDPAQALADFDAALARPQPFFVEEARASRILALDRLGRAAERREACDDFRARHPESVHHARLRSACR